jgi:hypothetical protein
MQSLPNPAVSGQQFRTARSGTRSKSWTSGVVSADLKGWQSPQKQYERYIALARSQALTGDTVGAENYYQHAEHHFRSISTPSGH